MNQLDYNKLIKHHFYLEQFGIGLSEKVNNLMNNKKLKDFVFEKRKKVRKLIEELVEKEKEKAKKLIGTELYSMAKLELSFMKQLGKDFKDLGLDKKGIQDIITMAMNKPLVVSKVEVQTLFDQTFQRKADISKTLNTMIANDLINDNEAKTNFNAMLKQFANGMTTSNTTFIFAVANEVREDSYSKIKSVDRVIMSAVLDGRTTPYCMAIDGTIFPKGEGPRPPFHARCRTIAIPLLDDDIDEDINNMLSIRSTIGAGKNYEKGDNTRLKAHKSLIDKGIVKLGVGGESKTTATNYGQFLAGQRNTEHGKQFIFDKLGKKRGEQFIDAINNGLDPSDFLKNAYLDFEPKGIDIKTLANKSLNIVDSPEKIFEKYTKNIKLPGISTEMANSIFNGLEKSIGKYKGIINSITLSEGYKYSPLASITIKTKELVFNNKSIKNYLLKADKAYENYESNIYDKIRKLEYEIKKFGERVPESTKQRLKNLKSIKRFSIYQIAEDKFEAIAIHEGFHSVYRTNNLENKWEKLLKKYNVSSEDIYSVSEYAGVNESELFSEVGTAIELGIKIPKNIKKAFKETLKNIK